MPIYPALQARTFNLPQIAAQAQQVRGMGIQNRLGEARLKAFEGDQARQGQFNKLVPGIMSGDEGAIAEGNTLDVDQVSKILDQVYQMDEAGQKKAADQSRKVARVGYGWLQMKDAGKQAVTYETIRDIGDPNGEDPPPKEYGPDAILWVQRHVDLATSVADKLKQGQEGAKPPSGYRWAAGGTLEAIPGGPGGEKPSAAMKNAEAMGLKPGTPGYDQYLRDVTLKPLVNFGGQETERQKKYGGSIGTYYGELFTGLQGAAREGRKQSANLDRLDQLLDQTETGFGQEFILKAKKLGETLGFETAGIGTDVAPAEAAMALSNEMALQLRNPAGGAGMPGSLSDKDREFLVSMVPGLGQTRGGRKLLIRARKKIAKRAENVAKMARKYHQKNGAIDAGFEDELAEWSEKNPLFTAEDFSTREKARLPTPKSAAERDALASGTYYQSPDGQVRRTAVR